MNPLLLCFYGDDCTYTGMCSAVNSLLADAGDSRDKGSIPGREDPLEKEMATHSSVLAWRIPWTEEPGRLQSAGSQGVGQV